MGLIDRLLGRDATVPVTPTAAPSMVYPTTVPYASGTTALGLSAVWRSVTLIADTIADMPWREWKGDEAAPIPLASSRLVRRPMASMTRREWTWRVVATEALYSTAYLLHVGGTDSEGLPWSLLPVPPDAISPTTPTDPWGLTQPLEYRVGSMIVSAEDLTIIRRHPWPNISDDAAGIIDLARRQFAGYLAADTHMTRYWQSGGPTITVLTTDQELSDPEANAIAERWVNRRALGADFPAVLGKGAHADGFGADPTTDSAVEARREIVADIGRYFGLPTRILNAPAGDTETYANTEEDKADLLALTLRGYMGPVEDGISELLPGDYVTGRRMRMDPARLLQGNLMSRAQAYPALVAAGIVTVDEARAAGFGLGPTGAPAPTPQAQPDALPGALTTIGG